MHTLIKILEKSIEKNGADKVLTIGHLLNILKLANDLEVEEADKRAFEHNEIMNSIHFGCHGSNE